MRIYLIGYSYGGKTTMGRRLAERLNYRFFDTDKAIELKYHSTISLFLNRYGEKAFRIVESQILQSTADIDDVVVATGGGASCSDANIRFILDHGIAVHMFMNLDDVMARIAVARKGRPLLTGKSIDEQREFIAAQLEERMRYYSQAHITVPAYHASPDTIIAALDDYLATH